MSFATFIDLFRWSKQEIPLFNLFKKNFLANLMICKFLIVFISIKQCIFSIFWTNFKIFKNLFLARYCPSELS